jgi:hypothetical protein
MGRTDLLKVEEELFIAWEQIKLLGEKDRKKRAEKRPSDTSPTYR